MKGQYTLQFDFKSNERPWKGTHTNTIDMNEEEALNWLNRFQEEMPNYYISLKRNW